MLTVRDLQVRYGGAVTAIRRLSLDVPPGSAVAVLGSNGAGKTTLLRAISGVLREQGGAVHVGTIEFEGRNLVGRRAADIVAAGVVHAPEGRRIFERLTVAENLRVGGYSLKQSAARSRATTLVHDLFPVLYERRRERAGLLSGGQQQMLAIGRALMSSPKVLLLDEPSLGLAPRLVEQIRDIVVDINAQGTSVLLVEQNATMALAIADHGLVMEQGRIVRSGRGDELLADRNIREFYLGMSQAAERRSFRDVKTYRRKKSWGA
jgi:branched-chain amino acid transport system ATP-binding protein